MSTDIPVHTSVDTRLTIDQYSIFSQYSTGVSNDTRSSLGQVSADSPLNDAHDVGRRIDHDTVGGTCISVNYGYTCISVNCWSSLGRLSVNIYMG